MIPDPRLNWNWDLAVLEPIALKRKGLKKALYTNGYWNGCHETNARKCIKLMRLGKNGQVTLSTLTKEEMSSAHVLALNKFIHLKNVNQKVLRPILNVFISFIDLRSPWIKLDILNCLKSYNLYPWQLDYSKRYYYCQN